MHEVVTYGLYARNVVDSEWASEKVGLMLSSRVLDVKHEVVHGLLKVLDYEEQTADEEKLACEQRAAVESV